MNENNQFKFSDGELKFIYHNGYLLSQGGICMNAGILKRMNAPKKKWVDAISMIKLMREYNDYANEDNFSEHEHIIDFIAEIEGIVIENCDNILTKVKPKGD